MNFFNMLNRQHKLKPVGYLQLVLWAKKGFKLN